MTEKKNKGLRRPVNVIKQEEPIKELQRHFDNMREISLERFLFTLVIAVDKTLFALISGALTGIFTNVLIGALDFPNYQQTEIHLHLLQLGLSFLFNCLFILFSARVIRIQESGDLYIPPVWSSLDHQQLRQAKYNVVYGQCVRSSRYLKATFCLSVITGVFMLISFFNGIALLSGVKEGGTWTFEVLKCLWRKFIKW